MGEARRRKEAGEVSLGQLMQATRARPRVTVAEMPEMTFEIVTSPSLEFPFRIKRTEANGTTVYFQCRTLDEATAKMNAIAIVLAQDGHPLEVV